MSTPFNGQVEQLLADFAQQQSLLLGARNELQAAVVTATSKDHLVTVTLGVDGEIRNLQFHSTDYASMAPPQLADVLTRVINEARAKAAARAQEAFRPFADLGAEVGE